MGPPFFDGGNQHSDNNLALEITAASMGPPFFDGGNAVVVMSDGLVGAFASMGPPFFDGGNDSESTGDRHHATRFNGAAVF